MREVKRSALTEEEIKQIANGYYGQSLPLFQLNVYQEQGFVVADLI
jgi:hypothetical protein